MCHLENCVPLLCFVTNIEQTFVLWNLLFINGDAVKLPVAPEPSFAPRQNLNFIHFKAGKLIQNRSTVLIQNHSQQMRRDCQQLPHSLCFMYPRGKNGMSYSKQLKKTCWAQFTRSSIKAILTSLGGKEDCSGQLYTWCSFFGTLWK